MGYLITPPPVTDGTNFTVYFDEPLSTDNDVAVTEQHMIQVGSAFTETPAILTGFQSN
jgi:hypothetical protein